MGDFDDLGNLKDTEITEGNALKRFLDKQNEQGQPEKKIDDALQAAKI